MFVLTLSQRLSAAENEIREIIMDNNRIIDSLEALLAEQQRLLDMSSKLTNKISDLREAINEMHMDKEKAKENCYCFNCSQQKEVKTNVPFHGFNTCSD